MNYMVMGMHRLEHKHTANKMDQWEVHLTDKEGFKVILQMAEKPAFNPGDTVSLVVGKVNA